MASGRNVIFYVAKGAKPVLADVLYFFIKTATCEAS